MASKVTVWDIANARWVNIPEAWTHDEDFDDLFSREKPVETPPEVPVDKPAKANEKEKKNA